MNPHIRDEWVRRLLSGNFKQGRAYLNRVEDSGLQVFCCLGVLTEFAAEQGIVKRAPYPTAGVTGYVSVDNPQDSSACTLPHAVRKWAGLLSVNPELKAQYMPGTDAEKFSLTLLNDRYEVPFGRLAVLIERQL